ncbi:hypothetical protein C8J56DRAFT_1024157 [Mycena floridula]|nr:hypothetical protein C8J56DRAFT_1024157 [Mycena floridula]
MSREKLIPAEGDVTSNNSWITFASVPTFDSEEALMEMCPWCLTNISLAASCRVVAPSTTLLWVASLCSDDVALARCRTRSEPDPAQVFIAFIAPLKLITQLSREKRLIVVERYARRSVAYFGVTQKIQHFPQLISQWISLWNEGEIVRVTELYLLVSESFDDPNDNGGKNDDGDDERDELGDAKQIKEAPNDQNNN